MSQLALLSEATEPESARTNATANRLGVDDRAVHDWYRFVLSFPPHLVRDYLQRFKLAPGQTVLDPFCGTGTTVVEAKLQGLAAVGVEANALAHFAGSVKTDWMVDPAALLRRTQQIAAATRQAIERSQPNALRTLPAEAEALLLKGSISPLPLHKVLLLLEQIDSACDEPGYRHLRLALAHTLVYDASNLHFGPEVGVRRTKLVDAPVVESWLAAVERMADDLYRVDRTAPPVTIHHADARRLSDLLEPRSIDAVFTSPPYPNEKDYTRTTRLESVVLGYMHNKADLRAIKQGLLRSNTRNVYKQDDDDAWVADHAEIQALATEIERRRVELGKTSGFERLYARVTRLYFGGMARHLAELRPFLKPGAQIGYVVGDQAS
ncbi:MAG: DNA methyltransferase [Caldilinea sp.]|uniref:DNA methyltransferase n=1 Tax=Caldilinea sp. TaxID=2293560 RepID=UPI002CAC37AF|nr:DNA methyltransferase [Caldilinea sp.]